jgi:hypothetical protein
MQYFTFIISIQYKHVTHVITISSQKCNFTGDLPLLQLFSQSNVCDVVTLQKRESIEYFLRNKDLVLQYLPSIEVLQYHSGNIILPYASSHILVILQYLSNELLLQFISHLIECSK